MNVVVLRGTVSRAPESRPLPSGSVLLQVDLSTPLEEGTTSVPVAWLDPPAPVTLAAGDEVVLTGSVRRRFFRAGGATQSRTEVMASSVARASNRKAVAKLLDAACATIRGD